MQAPLRDLLIVTFQEQNGKNEIKRLQSSSMGYLFRREWVWGEFVYLPLNPTEMATRACHGRHLVVRMSRAQLEFVYIARGSYFNLGY